MELICIKCPVGCRLTVENGVVSGNECPRGKTYAIEETTRPMRILTTLVIAGGVPVSVKTAREIPKERMNDCLDEIKKLQLSLPVNIGDVLIKNVCDTGVNVVATKSAL